LVGSFNFERQGEKSYTYLTVEEVILLNIRIMDGQKLLRDKGGLESAIMRPQMASHYEDADIVEQAAFLVDGICMSHAFVDGNKRTALLACVTFLDVNRFKLKRNREELGREIEALVVTRDMEHFIQWLRTHIRPL